MASLRHLIIILGDQLNLDSSAFDGFDPAQDCIFMAEVTEESTHVWSSKMRIAVFLSAMRHFKGRVEKRGWPMEYRALDAPENRGTLALELDDCIHRLKPSELVITAPGDWRVQKAIKAVAQSHGLPLDLRDDRHFFSTIRDFASHAQSRRQVRMEFWYRSLRQRTGILMDGETPAGGQWNFDADNRKPFGTKGPPEQKAPKNFVPDELTLDVIAMVKDRFRGHPGTLTSFQWPMSPEQAEEALNDFLDHRLSLFGPYEDAMWEGEPWLFHSRLSMAMNLKLIDPHRVITQVEQRYRSGQIGIESAEGFVRQILGWREYVRGIYWTQMPQYLEMNALEAKHDLPDFFWTGKTSLNCLRECLTQSLEQGYAHHIQRLMVIGLFALLFGVRPAEVHRWFLAVYVDAVEWVELPNTLGMSQYGDGGFLGSKPYIASGQYIKRMSNYCNRCPYDPALKTGERACPYTTLYWDFLIRHRERLSRNPRMGMQIRNLDRLPEDEQNAIAQAADLLRQTIKDTALA
jgi:deoxyribodipyrimidine photolyase-related protein